MSAPPDSAVRTGGALLRRVRRRTSARPENEVRAGHIRLAWQHGGVPDADLALRIAPRTLDELDREDRTR